ncbi:hypothetical protein BRPE64_ECDS00040 (plasmid) [Caballeronia insecticola]|uniref:Uncharacterized protein n=1 Tax=Caballeronia insecticola TaxID=758793 RepID=R4X5F6_9BURK|nr:hypothetical protein BRPE64_ECDS00040 [Caballeronia insecticola]
MLLETNCVFFDTNDSASRREGLFRVDGWVFGEDFITARETFKFHAQFYLYFSL